MGLGINRRGTSGRHWLNCCAPYASVAEPKAERSVAEPKAERSVAAAFFSPTSE
jgi:hypothetical protein